MLQLFKWGFSLVLFFFFTFFYFFTKNFFGTWTVDCLSCLWWWQTLLLEELGDVWILIWVMWIEWVLFVQSTSPLLQASKRARKRERRELLLSWGERGGYGFFFINSSDKLTDWLDERIDFGGNYYCGWMCCGCVVVATVWIWLWILYICNCYC